MTTGGRCTPEDVNAPARPLRNSIRATYDSRETGPRYHLTTRVGPRTIEFEKPLQDPFVMQRVILGWRDLLRGLIRRRLVVEVQVGGDMDVVNDVLELDDDCLIQGSTRAAAFRSHLNETIGRFADGDAP
jgi:hypothetical protein